MTTKTPIKALFALKYLNISQFTRLLHRKLHPRKMKKKKTKSSTPQFQQTTADQQKPTTNDSSMERPPQARAHS